MHRGSRNSGGATRRCNATTPPTPTPCRPAQTGAGKTFTMSGGSAGYGHRGIIPRALHHVFREVDLRVDKMFRVQVC